MPVSLQKAENCRTASGAVGTAGNCRRGLLCTLPNFRMRSYSVKLRSVYAVQDWGLGRRTLWMRAGDGFWR